MAKRKKKSMMQTAVDQIKTVGKNVGEYVGDMMPTGKKKKKASATKKAVKKKTAKKKKK